VPGYIAQRTRLGLEDLDALPTFDQVLDEFLEFLADRPVCAQDVLTTWAFIEREARRAGRTLRTPVLLDINALADALLDFPGKPTLSLIAERLAIGVVHVGQPTDEARVIAAAWAKLLERATATGLRTQDVL